MQCCSCWHMMQFAWWNTCCVVRMEMCQEVILAACILEVEPINHKVGAINPFDVLYLLRHLSGSAELQRFGRTGNWSNQAVVKRWRLKRHRHHLYHHVHCLGHQMLQNTLMSRHTTQVQHLNFFSQQQTEYHHRRLRLPPPPLLPPPLQVLAPLQRYW